MLDGGVCDSIPVCRAREDGFLNNVVILTKPKEYRKPNKKFYLPKFLLHKYPKLRHQLVMVISAIMKYWIISMNWKTKDMFMLFVIKAT